MGGILKIAGSSILLFSTILSASSYKGHEIDLKKISKLLNYDKNHQGIRSMNPDLQCSIEVYTGLSVVDPTNLNRRIREGAGMYGLKRDTRINYIKDTYSIGMKLKYYLTRKFAISLGVEAFSRKKSTYFDEHLKVPVINMISSRTLQENYTRAYIPAIGFHFRSTISKNLNLETFISAGPMFGKAYYKFKFINKNENQSLPGTVEVKEERTGLGVALNCGCQLNISLIKDFGMFIQGSYGSRIVNKISGTGSLKVNGSKTDSWDGGENILFIPQKQLPGKFRLNLSGFSIKIGFYYRFQ